MFAERKYSENEYICKFSSAFTTGKGSQNKKLLKLLFSTLPLLKLKANHIVVKGLKPNLLVHFTKIAAEHSHV